MSVRICLLNARRLPRITVRKMCPVGLEKGGVAIHELRLKKGNGKDG